MNLEIRAVKLSEALGGVVFIGGFAVRQHTGTDRRTDGLDFAMATKLTDTELEDRGVSIFTERGKTIRRWEGVKIDVYNREVNGIPIDAIYSTAVPFKVWHRLVMVMALELLIVSKLRANRDQDREDVASLFQRLGSSIDWNLIKSEAGDDEVKRLRAHAVSLGIGVPAWV